MINAEADGFGTVQGAAAPCGHDTICPKLPQGSDASVDGGMTGIGFHTNKFGKLDAIFLKRLDRLLIQTASLYRSGIIDKKDLFAILKYFVP